MYLFTAYNNCNSDVDFHHLTDESFFNDNVVFNEDFGTLVSLRHDGYEYDSEPLVNFWIFFRRSIVCVFYIYND